MAYTLPNFASTCNIATGYGSPSSGLTVVGPVSCQKYINPKPTGIPAGGANYWLMYSVQFRFEPTAFYALFPRQNYDTWALSFVAFDPAFGPYWYRIWQWDIMHYDFVNEYPAAWGLLCRPSDGMYITPGSANDQGFPVGFPYSMGYLP